MVSSLVLAALAAAIGAQVIDIDNCDPEYECEFRSKDSSRAFYDLKPLCGNQEYYNYTDAAFPASGLSLVFQICGLANTVCVPPYKVAFNRATAIQFIDNGNKGLMCNDTNGVSVPCTGNCEILGEGPPTIGLLDANNAYGGVQVTYFGVPSVGNDNFACPIDKRTGGPIDRVIKINITCDADYPDKPLIESAVESSICEYTVSMRSKYGCGCQPQCYGSDCGSDECGGFCGGTGTMGMCPYGQSCLADTGVCCKPDCANRQCGDDGCGGSCGTCGNDRVCSRYRQCMIANASPSPSQLVEIRTVETSADPADIAAGFFGGVFSTFAAVIGVSLYKRVRFGGTAAYQPHTDMPGATTAAWA